MRVRVRVRVREVLRAHGDAMEEQRGSSEGAMRNPLHAQSVPACYLLSARVRVRVGVR